MDTQICLLTTLLYLDMWAMVMLAPAPPLPGNQLQSPTHTDSMCVQHLPFGKVCQARPAGAGVVTGSGSDSTHPVAQSQYTCVCVCAVRRVCALSIGQCLVY